MILVEECRLPLDDTVDEWLPELKDRQALTAIDGGLDDTVPAKRRISLRDLLTFRCGYGKLVSCTRVALSPGCFEWDGALGTSWHVDPAEGLVGVLMTQRRPDMLGLPVPTLDFWTSVYQLIDD